MSENVIFCYSASGNCLDIAKTIAKELGDTDIIMMRSEPVKTDVTDAATVGFIFPCYAGGLPGEVEKFVSEVKVSASAYRYGVVSFAGYPGVGMAKVNDMLHLNYWAGISHQCSAIWLFPHTLQIPPIGPEKAEERSIKLAKYAAANVKLRVKMDGKPFAPAVNKLESKAWPMLSAKKAEKMQVMDACIGCGQCAKLCPKGNIIMEDHRPQFGSDCIGCLSCLQYCPKQAINMGGITLKRERYHNPNVTAQDLMQSIIHID